MALIVGTVGPVGHARGGAFMLPQGQGQFIAGVGYSAGSRRFDLSGHVIAAPSYTKAEASGYLEYGMTSEIDLVLAPTLDHARDAAVLDAVTGSESSALGARLLLYATSGRSVAVQALVEPFAHGATDLRLMLGQNLSLSGWPAFVDAEIGAHRRADPYLPEARLDLTFGCRPTDRLLLMIQDVSSVALPHGSLPRQAYSKLQVSAVQDLSSSWSIQIGGFRTIAGRNALQETGPLIALWHRF